VTLDVTVLGAGILGAAVAHHLDRQGARVTIIDAALPGRRATQASFACVNGSAKIEPDLAAINDRAVAEYREIAATLGPAAPRFTGQYFVATDAESLRTAERRVRAAQVRGYGGELVTSTTLRDREPQLHLAVEPLAVAWFEADGWADPEQLRRYFLGELAVQRRHAVSVVTDAVRRPRVLFADGESIDTDVVVNATGAGATDLVSDLHVSSPLGVIVCVNTQTDLVSAVVRTPILGVRPDGARRAVLHSHDTDKMVADGKQTPERAALLLIDRAQDLFPNAGAITARRIDAAPRPIPSGELPSVGRLPGIAGYYELVAHSGVTLAPLLGRLLATEILTGAEDPLLSHCRPARLRQLST